MPEQRCVSCGRVRPVDRLVISRRDPVLATCIEGCDHILEARRERLDTIVERTLLAAKGGQA